MSYGIKKSEIKVKLKKLKIHSDYLECVLNTYAIAILTEWSEFNSFDWNKIQKNIKKPVRIFDGRNILNQKKLNVSL